MESLRRRVSVREALTAEVITIDIIICECGERNPADAEFCRVCNAFLAWDRTTLIDMSKGPDNPPIESYDVEQPDAASPDTTEAEPDITISDVAVSDEGASSGTSEVDSSAGEETAAPGPEPVIASRPSGQTNSPHSLDDSPAQPPDVPDPRTRPTSSDQNPAAIECPSCGNPSPSHSRFCTRCGQRLAANDRPAEPPAPPTSSDENEQPSAGAPCPSCGHVGRRGQRYCTRCGDNLHPGGERPTALPQPNRENDGNPKDGSNASMSTNCPSCGIANPASRRYCRHCGYSFRSEVEPDWGHKQSAWSTATTSWSARREYQRSLTPYYRWRSIAVGAVAGVAVVGGLAALGFASTPAVKRFVFHQKPEPVQISDIIASIEPTSAVAPRYSPSRLTDGTRAKFTMKWPNTGGDPQECEPKAGSGTIVLTLAKEQKVSWIVIYPGLAEDIRKDHAQPTPSHIGILVGDDTNCHHGELQNSHEGKVIRLEGDTKVKTVSIAIQSSHKPGDQSPEQLISVSEIQLFTDKSTS